MGKQSVKYESIPNRSKHRGSLTPSTQATWNKNKSFHSLSYVRVKLSHRPHSWWRPINMLPFIFVRYSRDVAMPSIACQLEMHVEVIAFEERESFLFVWLTPRLTCLRSVDCAYRTS